MLDNVLQEHIENTITFTGTLYNEEAPTEAVKPYYVMNKISDPERPVYLCEDQGEAGDARFQFTLYADETTGYTKILMQAFKEQVKNIKGVIGTTEKYRIWQNITGGVIAPGEADSTTNTRAALFDIKIQWDKVT